jgi:DNA-binding GntR family transcriptional regulator
VREALLILERRHLVDILPRKGAMVSSLTEYHVNALYDFYISLLKMLVTSLTDKWNDMSSLMPLLNRIADMVKVDENSEEEVERFVESGFELMQEAAAFVDNPYLFETLENLRPAIHRTYILSMKVRNDGVQNSRNFFNNMAKGVVERDHEMLVHSVHEFADNQRKIVLEAL